jgi:hypothetical protein
MASAAGTYLTTFSFPPGGGGEPAPLQYVLSTHTLDHLSGDSKAHCAFEAANGTGDRRPPLTGEHPAAHRQTDSRGRWPRIARLLPRLIAAIPRAAVIPSPVLDEPARPVDRDVGGKSQFSLMSPGVKNCANTFR